MNPKDLEEKDVVAHPEHYERNTSLECIDTMRLAFGDFAVCYFCLCNAFKYLWRYKHKNGKEDLRKARWYVDYVKQVNLTDYIDNAEIEKMLYRVENLLESIEQKEHIW